MTWPGHPPQHQAAPAPCPLLVRLLPFLFDTFPRPSCLKQHPLGSTVAGVLSAPQDWGFPYGIFLPDDRRAPVGNGIGAFLLPFAMWDM